MIVRTLGLAALLAAAIALPARAHMVWLERGPGGLLLYFGEPGENVREKTGGLLDAIKAPQLLGAGAAAPVRAADHVAFTPAPAGDARVIEVLAPREDRRRGGKTRTVFLAREGRSDPAAGLDLELVPTAPDAASFVLMFKGKPLPRTSVELIGPPGWSKALTTDAEGRVTAPLPWAGRYVAEVKHEAAEADPAAAGFDRTSYVSTLSFVAPGGVVWEAAR